MKTFINNLKNKGFQEKTINVYLYYIKKYKHYSIDEITMVLNNLKKRPYEEKSYNIYSHTKILNLTNFKNEKDFELKKWKALFRFLYTSGIRVGELNNIDVLDDTKIKIFGKGGKTRMCFYSKDAYIECVDIIGKYTDKTIRVKCKEILGDEYSPHNLRRSYATYLLKNGANPKMVQKTMGHADIKTTYRYMHNTIKEMEDEYDKYFKEVY